MSGARQRSINSVESSPVRHPPSSSPDCFGGDIPFVTPSDLDGRRTIDTTGRYLTEQGADSVASSRVPARAVMVSCIGSDMGKAAVAGRDCVTNQQINSIIVAADDDPLFIYYNLSTRKTEIRTSAGGSAQPILNKKAFGQLDIQLPPPATQRAIAHVLGTLDDKIELNRRMNETLEAMARALFQSWFVDFDPVRAKAEGRDPGLPNPLADLFPDRLVDSELGEIPEGWKSGRFGDVVEQLRDQENPLASPEVLFSHFSIPAFDDGQRAQTEPGENIKSQKSRVPPGVILLSKLNPEIERVWLADVEPSARALCSTEFIVLRPLPPYERSFVYCLARSPAFRQQIETLVTGTSNSHQRAQADSILSLAVVLPPKPVAIAFDEATSPLLGQTLSCRRESRTLAAVRDSLLPKLLKGEVGAIRRRPDAPFA